MSSVKKTKKQLIEELAEARARIAELEALEVELRQVEEALIKERNLLSIIINSLPDQIFVKDTQSRFLIANHAVARLAAVTNPDELVGKKDSDFHPPELAEQYYADEMAIIESGQPLINIEEPIIDQETGTRRWNLTTKVPFRDSQGEIAGFVGLNRDITELKQAEAERERLQQEIIEAQQLAIRELSTPIIPVMDRIIVMPLIGSIDTLRARDVMRTLLAGIREYRAKVVILDVTGVPIVDSGVANHLNKTIQAARLKGARTIVTGISDAVAETIVDLGVDWSGIETLSNLQTGLLIALDSLGIRLTHIESR